MSLKLVAKSGPLQGESFPLESNMVIGRSNAAINLNDPKVSSAHAVISRTGDNWLVMDNDSKNGIRDGEGARVREVILTPGALFSVGDSTFEVLSDAPAAPIPVPEAEHPGPRQEGGGGGRSNHQVKHWNDVLAEFLESKADQFQDSVIAIAPLEPALILEFVRGVQVNSKWILGFGPRRVGRASLDLPIWEPGAPDICFEIHPNSEGIIFKTGHPNIVHLNGRKIDREALRMGDTIKIMDTLIEVDFVE